MKEDAMEIKDFEEKKAFAMDFYEQAVEINQMVHDSIRGFHYLYGYNLQEGKESEIENPEKAYSRLRKEKEIPAKRKMGGRSVC